MILIRNAVVDDIAAIFAIRTAVKENHLSLEQLRELGITPQTVAALIEAAPAVWVAHQDQKIVGFAMADPEQGSLFALFVKPDYEGRGIGRQLLQTAENYLFQFYPTLWLETDQTSRAYQLYRQANWQQVAILNEHDVRLEKQK